MGIEDYAEWIVVVGRVATTWDKALLKVQSYSDYAQRFDAGGRIAIGSRPQPYPIISSRKSGHSFILDCGLTTVAEAQALVGSEIRIHPSMRAPLPAGEFYVDQMIGMRVVTTAGEELGEIVEVLDAKVHDVYVTPVAMIPSVDQFIIKRDFDAGIVTVRDVAGLRNDEP